MAASNLLTLIDDIATLLDDVAILSKVAAKKTAGVLGDDLALNAEQVLGASAEREIPIVWAVFKGSLLNKVILVPTALVLSAFFPWLVTPLLMIGGLFLCFEGFEKLLEKMIEKYFRKESTEKTLVSKMLEMNKEDIDNLESDKIKGAIRTDFILSAEIIAITLGIVASETFLKQASVLIFTALAMTVFVYGLVAGIVKIDDFGLYLINKHPKFKNIGRGIVLSAPVLMKVLGILGTVAMFLVGGGILCHGIPFLHSISSHFLFEGFIGLISGAICVGLIEVYHKIRVQR